MGIGISRKQRVFAVLETTQGAVKFPAAANFIRPAGDAIINQSPDFVDSEEKQDTLDILDRFQNARPPGEFTIPMYLRTDSSASFATPQGDAIWQSLQGGRETWSCTIATIAGVASTQATFRTLVGTPPKKGVFHIGAETFFYHDWSTSSSTMGTFYFLNSASAATGRGYHGTSAAIHNTGAAGSAATVCSIFYKQETTSPSMTIWVETDHFVQGLIGATVGQMTVGVTNEGAVILNITGQGMEMVWAGTTTVVAGTHAGGGAASLCTVDDARAFTVDSYIQNFSAGDNNSGAGYKVISSNATTNVIGWTPAAGALITWATSATICGYLPSATVVGTAIESRYTDVEIDDVDASIKNTDLTISVPKQYVTDEVGTTFPEDYMEQVRDISSTLDLYFRDTDFTYFKDGYDGNAVELFLKFGSAEGGMLGMLMKNVSLTVPSVGFSAPAVNLSIPMKALGTVGEDSLEIITL